MREQCKHKCHRSQVTVCKCILWWMNKWAGLCSKLTVSTSSAKVIDTMISAFSAHSFSNLNRHPTSSLSSSSLLSFRSSASMLGGQRESQTWENVTLPWQRDLFVLPICSTSVCMCVLNVWVCLKQSNHMRLYHITSFKEKSHKHSALMLNSDVMWW